MSVRIDAIKIAISEKTAVLPIGSTLVKRTQVFLSLRANY